MRQGDSFGPLNGSIQQVANSPALFHNMSQYKAKPIFGSECCCCNTMRDEDVGCESSNGVDVCVQKSFSADCAQEQTAVYDNAPFVVGTMVWTLFDCKPLACFLPACWGYQREFPPYGMAS